MTELLISDGGTLNAFQPVKGGFRFVGTDEDAKRWISHNIAICAELENKYQPIEMMRRLFHSTIDMEMIEDLYVAYMKVKKSLEKESK